MTSRMNRLWQRRRRASAGSHPNWLGSLYFLSRSPSLHRKVQAPLLKSRPSWGQVTPGVSDDTILHAQPWRWDPAPAPAWWKGSCGSSRWG